MVKQITRGKDIARNTYWSAVGMTAATMLAVQPVFADTMPTLNSSCRMIPISTMSRRS